MAHTWRQAGTIRQEPLHTFFPVSDCCLIYTSETAGSFWRNNSVALFIVNRLPSMYYYATGAFGLILLPYYTAPQKLNKKNRIRSALCVYSQLDVESAGGYSPFTKSLRPTLTYSAAAHWNVLVYIDQFSQGYSWTLFCFSFGPFFPLSTLYCYNQNREQERGGGWMTL